MFREDLLARIDLWTYQLPSLNERGVDLELNIDFEQEAFSGKSGYLVKFNKVAREQYPAFCRSPDALLTANFRDLNTSITRMGTLADRGRITVTVVEEEIGRLRYEWQSAPGTELNPRAPIEPLLGPGSTEQMDYDEPLKLANLIEVCRSCNPMAEAGRKLFNISRERKKSSNNAHRVKQLLEKHGVRFKDIKAALLSLHGY